MRILGNRIVVVEEKKKLSELVLEPEIARRPPDIFWANVIGLGNSPLIPAEIEVGRRVLVERRGGVPTNYNGQAGTIISPLDVLAFETTETA